MKKLAIIGRGTVGCTSVAHFLHFTDCEIDWYYDPSINPTPVGEATNLAIMQTWRESLGMFADSHFELQSTSKIGIMKRDWGSLGKTFLHPFRLGQTAIHFSGHTFQQVVFDKIKDNKRVTLHEGNFEPEDIDSDYVMVCTGSPNELNDDFIVSDCIPVNACLVSQCEWDHARFDYSLTYAMPNGWAFGIPLRNRCSIGYVHNSDFADRETINEEIEPLLDELDLVPSSQNYLNFNNYYRKQNFTDRIVYNGNASFFLEPLEATSTNFADNINRNCFDLWFSNQLTVDQCNEGYLKELRNTELMMSLHYASGSSFDTEFWSFAKDKGLARLKQGIENDELFIHNLFYNIAQEVDETMPMAGSWDAALNYRLHIDKLGMRNTLFDLVAGPKLVSGGQ